MYDGIITVLQLIMSYRGLHVLQKVSLSLMSVLMIVTFVGASLHAHLWQSSTWLVSTVLPAVVVDLTNDERAENSLAPLLRSVVLDKAAKLKAEDMARYEYFAHHSPSGVSPWYWFSEAGYVYAHAGENLAIHFTDSTEVVEAWMNSPTHRQNIVGSQYTEIGVGTAKGKYEGYDTVYVVQLFGTPAVPPAPAVVAEKEILPPVSVTEDVSVSPVSEPVNEVSNTESLVPPEAAVPLLVKENLAPTAVAAAEDSQKTEEVARIEEVSVPALEYAVETIPESARESEIVMIESPLISTSSGLAIAQVTTPNLETPKTVLPTIVTQPNALLEMIYFVLGSIVVLLLVTSVAVEARRFHVTQVVYGVLLLCGMGALWYVHLLLTNGAVIG